MTKKNEALQVFQPAQLLELALEKGHVDQLEQLMALQERWEAREAKKDFDAAMANFKAACPQIVGKDATVDFKSAKGRTYYKHASLAGIVALVTPYLSAEGLHVTWSVDQETGAVFVTCHVSHVAGHRESVKMGGPSDQSGNKNPLQAINSAVTYLQRYTIVAALGLATGEDDDAQSAYQDAKPAPKPKQYKKPAAAKKPAPKAEEPPAEKRPPAKAAYLKTKLHNCSNMEELTSVARECSECELGEDRNELLKIYATRKTELSQSDDDDFADRDEDDPSDYETPA